jgi:hypothetical protein
MERRLFQCFKESIRYIMSHPICSCQDTDTSPSFIGLVSQLPLHLHHLLFLDALTYRFNEQHIRMKSMINLFAGGAMITGISSLSLSVEAVEGLCKLESHDFLSDPFAPQEEVAVHDLLISDRPL